MDKSSFFTSLGGYLKANKAFFLSVLLIVLVAGGYFWWQMGYSFEIGRFFAVFDDGGDIVRECARAGDLFCSGNNVMMWETDDIDGGCISGVVETCSYACSNGACVAPPATPPPATPPPATPTPTPTSGAVACPCGGGAWGNNGVTICKSGGNIDTTQRCTNMSPGSQASVTVTICNGSNKYIYSKEALFYQNQQTCGAHAANPGHSSISGDTGLNPGEVGQTTYSFNVGSCGSWQLDDTWRSGDWTVFVIGQVINTGVNCPTPPPASPSTPPASPSVPPASPSTSPSTPPASPSTSPTPGDLICTPLNQTVGVGQTAILTASGGVPPYSWYAPNGNPSSGTAQGIAVTYAAPGNYSVALNDSSGTKESICYVTVTGEPSPSTSASPSPSPWNLECAANVPQATVGQPVTFNTTGGRQPGTWYAPGGQISPPMTYTTTPFIVSYSTPGLKTVTISEDIQVGPGEIITEQGSCTVTIVPQPTVSPSVSPSPEVSPSASPSTSASPSASPSTTVSPSTSPSTTVSPSGSPAPSLVCAPATQSVRRGNPAHLTATSVGISGALTWSAPDGDPASGSGSSFTTEYDRTGTYMVTVKGGNLTSACTVKVTSGGNGTMTHLKCVNNTCTRVTGSGTNECSSVGASCGGSGGPYVALDKLVRNVTQNSAEQNSVTAAPGNIVEFSLKVIAHGSGTLNSVTVRDALPAGLTYVPGSTTIDGVAGSDGIVSTGLNLGNMPSGRTITVRFRATVSSASFFSAGTTVLTNTGHARAANDGEVSDVAFVSVVQMPANATMSLTKTGRNTTRGETAEASLVNASPAQTIEFVLRVRNTSSKTLNNVMARDVLPTAITLVPGSVRIGTASASDALTTAGLSIGTLTPGQEVVVRFSGLVASSTQLPSGTTTVINTATVSATGEPTITAQLPVVISNGGVVIPPVKTGPGETTVLALIISAIITLLYVGYTSTETYRRHEAGEIARESRGDESDFSK